MSLKIESPKGKFGVLTPGMGAVSTTFMAGVHAVLKGLGEPVGSLTQLGTIRLGKRTDNRVPKIQDFVPLAGLKQLVFGGWDIFEDNAYEAALKRSGSQPGPARETEISASEDHADEGGIRQALCEAHRWTQCED